MTDKPHLQMPPSEMTTDIKRRAQEALEWCGEQIPGKWNVGFLNAAKDDLPWALKIVLAACDWRNRCKQLGPMTMMLPEVTKMIDAILAGKGADDE